MIANYHTHTWRCNHALPGEETYIEHAIARGLKKLGFSDHTPYFFQGGYYSTFRMRPSQLTGYCDCISRLSEKHKDQIEIHLGLEAEYYPKNFRELLPFLRDMPIEYLILGQHFPGDELELPYSGRPTDDVDVLHHYCRSAMEAMQTGLFTYFAHPDLIHFLGDDAVYCAAMRELFREAKSCGMPLEVNLLGVLEGRHYPSERFFALAAEENCPVIMGIDAHFPEALSNTAPEKAALKMVAKYGLTLLEDIPLRSIR